MPGSAAAILPVGPGSKARDLDNAKPVTGAAEGPGGPRPSLSQIKSTPAASKEKREKLNAVAKRMSSGEIMSREQVAEDDAPIVDPGDVSDSAAIAPTKEPAPEPKPAKAGKDKEPTPAEKEAVAAKAKRLTSAKRALALDGWKPERIAKMEEDDILDIGEHRAKNQADVNREFAKLRNTSSPTGARNDDGTFAAPKDATTAGDKAKPEAPKEDALDPELEALVEGAKDDIGEPASKLLKSAFKVLEAKYKKQSELGSSITTEMLYSKGYDVVAAEYPDQLSADPTSFDEVAENFKALVASGRYGRGQISKAWSDAAVMAYGLPKTVRKAQRDMLARQDAADVGRIDSGRGDTGATTDAPITATKDALKYMASLMAKNPNANPDKLRELGMAKIRGNR